jgi:hypothetical protein
MKVVARLIYSLVLSLALLLGSSHSAGAQKRDGFILEQKSLLVGSQTVTVCADGLCCSDGRIKLVARAPEWRVSLFNLENKNLFSIDATHFFGYLLPGKAMEVSFGLKPLSARGSARYHGLSVAEYHSPTAFMQQMAHQKQLGEVAVDEPQEIKYNVFNGLSAPGAATNLLSRLYRVPVKQGVPASLSFRTVSGEQVRFLETVSIKHTKVDADMFNVPSQLKEVGSAALVVGN